MKLKNLRKPERRARYLSFIKKKLVGIVGSRDNSKPIFIAGFQRSGTTMLIDVFYLHPEVEIYNELPNSKVFYDYRVRSIQVLDSTVQKSYYPFVLYKVICDSHILLSFKKAFPEAKFIWMYRSAEDNADSRLRKFPQGTRSIRLIAQDKPGAGWLAEGLSPEMLEIIKELTTKDLTDFDYACLTWWVRNKLFFELGLEQLSSVRLVQYEQLVQNPKDVMNDIFDWLGLQKSDSSLRFVHARSVNKPDLPKLHPDVATLCNGLKDKLDKVWYDTWHAERDRAI